MYVENESFCVAGACFVTDSVSSSSSSSGSQSVSQSVAAPTPTRNADTRPVQHMHVVPPPPPSVATASAVLHRASERASALINDPAGVAERQQLAAVGIRSPVDRPPGRPPPPPTISNYDEDSCPLADRPTDWVLCAAARTELIRPVPAVRRGARRPVVALSRRIVAELLAYDYVTDTR